MVSNRRSKPKPRKHHNLALWLARESCGLEDFDSFLHFVWTLSKSVFDTASTAVAWCVFVLYHNLTTLGSLVCIYQSNDFPNSIPLGKIWCVLRWVTRMRRRYYLQVVCLWKILYELDVFVSSLNALWQYQCYDSKRLWQREKQVEATKNRLEATKNRLEATKNRLEATKNRLEATKNRLEATKSTTLIFARKEIACSLLLTTVLRTLALHY